MVNGSDNQVAIRTSACHFTMIAAVAIASTDTLVHTSFATNKVSKYNVVIITLVFDGNLMPRLGTRRTILFVRDHISRLTKIDMLYQFSHALVVVVRRVRGIMTIAITISICVVMPRHLVSGCIFRDDLIPAVAPAIC